MPEIVQLLQELPEGYSFSPEVQKSYESMRKNNEAKDLENRRREEFPSAFAHEKEKEEQEMQNQEPYDSSEESPLGTLGRGALRTVARAGESVLGSPSDLIHGVFNGTSWLLGSKKQAQESPLGYLPTSQNIRKNVTQRATGNYLEPANQVESTIDDISGLSAALLSGNPRKLIQSGFKEAAKHVGKKVVLATTAEGLGKTTENLTGSPLAGAVVRAGTLVGASLIGGKKSINDVKVKDYDKSALLAEKEGLKGRSEPVANRLKTIKEKVDSSTKLLTESERKKMTDLIGQLEKNIEPTKTIPPTSTLKAKALEHIKHETEKAVASGKAAPKLKVADLIREQKVKGSLTVSKAMDMLKDVNEQFKDATKGEKEVLYKLNGTLNNFIESHGKKSPEFLKSFKRAQEIHAAQAAMPQTIKNLNENLTLSKAVSNAKPISFLGSGIKYALGTKGIAAAGALLGGLITAKEAGSLFYVLKNSPAAYKAYTDFIKAGQLNNGAAMVRAFTQLDKAAAALGR